MRDLVYGLDWTEQPKDDFLRVIARLDRRFFSSPEQRLSKYISVYEHSTKGEFQRITKENLVPLLHSCRGLEDSPSPCTAESALMLCSEILSSMDMGEEWYYYHIDYIPPFIRTLKGYDLPLIPHDFVTAERLAQAKGASVRSVVDYAKARRIDGMLSRMRVWAIDPNEKLDYWISNPDEPTTTYRRLLSAWEILQDDPEAENLWDKVEQEELNVQKFGACAYMRVKQYMEGFPTDLEGIQRELDRAWDLRQAYLYGEL